MDRGVFDQFEKDHGSESQHQKEQGVLDAPFGLLVYVAGLDQTDLYASAQQPRVFAGAQQLVGGGDVAGKG